MISRLSVDAYHLLKEIAHCYSYLRDIQSSCITAPSSQHSRLVLRIILHFTCIRQTHALLEESLSRPLTSANFSITTFIHDLYPRSLSTTFIYDLHPRPSSTTFIHDLHPRHKSTTFIHDINPRHKSTTYTNIKEPCVSHHSSLRVFNHHGQHHRTPQ
jgi:hypothetical protein